MHFHIAKQVKFYIKEHVFIGYFAQRAYVKVMLIKIYDVCFINFDHCF